MASGGSIQKLVVNGLQRTLSSDNDPKFTLGGRYPTEKQETTGEPYFLFDNASGCLTGLEERVSHLDGSLQTLQDAVDKCGTDGNVSALVVMPDGSKYSASGGAVIVIDGATDGMMSVREGKVTYGLHPVKGKWIKS